MQEFTAHIKAHLTDTDPQSLTDALYDLMAHVGNSISVEAKYVPPKPVETRFTPHTTLSERTTVRGLLEGPRLLEDQR